MVDKCLYTSDYKKWKTPKEVTDFALKFWKVEKFDLDAACNDEHVPARCYYKEGEVDCLTHTWDVVGPGSKVWLNPPYGRDQTRIFLEKAQRESYERGCDIFCLIPARTDTVALQQLCLGVADIFLFIKGRLKFINDASPKNNAAPFPSLLVYYNGKRRPLPKLVKRFRRVLSQSDLEGTVLVSP